jgi:hypothetical protein
LSVSRPTSVAFMLAASSKHLRLLSLLTAAHHRRLGNDEPPITKKDQTESLSGVRSWAGSLTRAQKRSWRHQTKNIPVWSHAENTQVANPAVFGFATIEAVGANEISIGGSHNLRSPESCRPVTKVFSSSSLYINGYEVEQVSFLSLHRSAVAGHQMFQPYLCRTYTA